MLVCNIVFFLSVKISDKKALSEIPLLHWNDQQQPFGPISKVIHSFESLIQTDLGDMEFKDKTFNTFSFELDLKGSRYIEFLPFGRQTQAFVQSSWKTPKFYGNALPITHKIKESGFTAQWKVLELNRNYPQQWKEDEFDSDVLKASGFGVELLLPVSA